MLKKTLALALALVLTVACLASCDLFGGGSDPDPKELMAAAEAKLEDEPYTATVTTKMTAKVIIGPVWVHFMEQTKY